MMKLLSISSRRLLLGVLEICLMVFCSHQMIFAQAELEITFIKLGKLWVGVTANGAKSTSFDPRSGFFPNDYNIFANRGQDGDAFTGAGYRLTATGWVDPNDTLNVVSVFGATNDFMQNGLVIDSLRNYIRYTYPSQTVNYSPVSLVYPGIYDPSKFVGHSFDQLEEVTSQHVFGVNVHRKVMAWSQNYNDDYIMTDLEFENVGTDTLHNFYISFFEGNGNMYLSSIKNPYPPSNEVPAFATSWMHYYGGRVGDTARVFYEYSADNPKLAGDNMGVPATSQKGRLTYSNMTYWTVLHASAQPYVTSEGDVDDFLQPRVTYIGNATAIPSPGGSDEYGNKDYWAISGGFSDIIPMDTINSFPGTHHGQNNDDIGVSDFSSYVAGVSSSSNNQKRYMSFGPYTFLRGQKLHIVYASGNSGISLPKAKEVGEKWLAGMLEMPPGLPDTNTGFLPANFVFPAGTTTMDKRKDLWISTGIDSAMKSAYRAKWNFEHNYNIPQSPPPPEKISIIGNGDGVEIKWSDLAAEALSNFAGYRIMRRVGTTDTAFYEVVYDSGATDKATEHTFVDKAIVYSASYYYYVQAKVNIDENDPNADPSTRGKMLFSSRLLEPDVTKVNPPTPPFYGALSKIRISPNPYNIKDPIIPSYGWLENRGLGFYNLPPVVTIRVYTESGDKVWEKLHDSVPRSGSVWWDMVTSSQQIINSGVYIAVFETPEGEVSYQKFVVVR
jgi:hypothetical protein